MTRFLSYILLAATLCSAAHAQAFCALRDPNRQIYSLFPKATSYRSIVRTVDQSARRQVGARLPFTLHFNELGRHTLYVPMRGDQVLGLVHVRSEAGRWGLVEVAWGLDLNLEVLDFEFQRCRDRQRAALEAPEARQELTGAGFEDLKAMLNESGDALKPGSLTIDAAASDLAVTVIRNGLKTMAATEAAWMEDLTALRAMALANRAMPTAHTLRRISPLYNEPCLALVAQRVGEAGTGVQRDSVAAWQVIDKARRPLGTIVSSAWRQDEIVTDLIYAVSREGKILKVETPGAWPTKEVARLFLGQVDKSPSDFEECSGPVELTTLELLTTLESHGLTETRK